MTGTGDKIIGFVESTDWKAVGADLKLLGASLGAVGFGLKALSFLGGGGLSGLFNAMIIGRIVGVTGALMGFAPMLAATATMLLGFDVAAAPITLAIAALGGADVAHRLGRPR